TRNRQNAVEAGPTPISASHHRAALRHPHAAQADDHAAPAHRARRSRPVSSFSENVQRVAVAVDNVIRFRHLFLEARIVRCELVAAVWRFDQEQSFAVGGVQTVDDLFRQYNPERVAKFADFEFQHGSPPDVITIVITSSYFWQTASFIFLPGNRS